MSIYRSKAKCPKCGSVNLIISETCEARTSFVQSNGYILKESSNNEYGNIIRLEALCERCGHEWRFRNVIQITGILESPNNF